MAKINSPLKTLGSGGLKDEKHHFRNIKLFHQEMVFLFVPCTK
jgi:hypothetical protein